MTKLKHARIVRLAAAALLLAAMCAATSAAQDYKVENVALPPPEEVAAAIRAELAAEGLRVTGPQGAYCEIWLAKQIAVHSEAEQAIGIAYGYVPSGTLFGVIRFLRDAQDYRRQTVKAGVYTMRYALLPVDGNHMGVAPNRDFLLLAPAAADSATALVSMEKLNELSRAAAGTTHPTIWSLTTTEGQHPQVPGMEHHAEENLWVLLFRIQARPGEGPAKAVLMALVLVGSAPEA
jgi:hypothetical protein